MAELRQYNPSLREKVAAMLQGDAKQGTMRAHLARAMAGSSVGGESDGIPLLDLTPAGVAFSANDAERAFGNKQYGKAGLAMAGMIPGARSAAGMAKEVVENLSKHAPGKLEELLKVGGGLKEGQDPVDFISKAFYGHELQDMVKQSKQLVKEGNAAALDQSRLPKMDHAKIPPDRGAIEDTRLHDREALDADRGNTVGAPSMRESLERNQKGATLKPSNIGAGSFEVTEQHIRDGQEPWQGAQPGYYKGSVEGDTEGPLNLEELVGNDPDKLNFVKNAMQDEGGNAPEDVAMTLVDSLKQNPQRLKELMDDHEIISSRGPQGVEINEDSLNELVQSLAESHSIPEMLGMHYDLNPSLKGAYGKAAPAAGRTLRKPTQ